MKRPETLSWSYNRDVTLETVYWDRKFNIVFHIYFADNSDI